MQAVRRIAGGAADERGFTMIVGVMVLMILMLLSVGAYQAVLGDSRNGAYTNDQKQAYAAAQAGLNWYLAQLSHDPSYWTQCTNVAQVPNGSGGTMPAPVNNPYSRGGGPDTSDTVQSWRTVDDPAAGSGRTSQSRYEIELLPANGKAACSTTDPVGTMIDTATGTMRIRVLGEARPGGAKRAIVATLRRQGFLDFLYFTDLETLDPPLTKVGWAAQGSPSGTDPVQWATDNCANRYAYGTNARDPSCTVIQFAPRDSVNGPFHSNDRIVVCGTPSFGRVNGSGQPLGDTLEDSAPNPGWVGAGCGGDSPIWHGSFQYGASTIKIPPTNNTQASTVTPGYQFTGRTWIRFNSDGTMTVTNATMGLTDATYPQPANGEIYIANAASGCTTPYDPLNPYGASQSCGDAYVQGTYMQNMTVATANDLVITGNIAPSGDVILGLVANDYVRVYHKVTPAPTTFRNGSCTSTNVANNANWDAQEPGSLSNLSVTAAILSVQHSFLVDNWECGTSLGTLSITGVIAQEYRGPVGTTGGTGYTKSYSYDDRLKFRTPPFFLDPVQSAWKIYRLAEQSPAV